MRGLSGTARWQSLESEPVFQSFCNKQLLVVRKKYLKSGRDVFNQGSGDKLLGDGTREGLGRTNSEGEGGTCRGKRRFEEHRSSKILIQVVEN